MIAIAGPSITEREIAYVTDAIAHGWFENANGYINRLEEAFRLYLGRKFAVSLPSCTSGLHLSLLALGIGPGDEVIVPDATWIASAAPITYLGATTVFADIDAKTWCLSAETVKPLITKKTKAIIAVNLYGHMPEYDDLFKLGIPIIEDSAESIGSTYKQRLSGTFGVTSCFSFHGSKTLTTGEGGMLVTDDEKIYQKIMIARDHGRMPGDTLFQNIEIGYKYKMSNLQAALGLAQLERIDELVKIKREIFHNYQATLRSLDFIKLNPDHPDVYNSYWMTTALFDRIEISKFELIKLLNAKKIATRPFFEPLSSLKAYSGHTDQERAAKQNINAKQIAHAGINLPCAANVTLNDIEYVAKSLGNIFAEVGVKV